MQRQNTGPAFEDAAIEAMMDRYRAELLRYQRATPPGAPTLEENLRNITESRAAGEKAAAPAESDLPDQEDAPVEKEAPPRAPAPLAAGCGAHADFARRTGVFGTFRLYDRLHALTQAAFLQRPGEPVPVLACFSADVEPGAPDAARCRRGFWVRFLTPAGPCDFPGGHLPVTMGRGADCLSALSLSLRPDPESGLRETRRFWQTVAAYPQALSGAALLYTDLGTIGSYRAIDGYGLPMVWQNAAGERRLVRCRWLARQRPQTLTRFEAEELSGSDPDAVARDLIDAIRIGDRPQFELCVQVIEPEAELSFDPLDPTRAWPENLFALRRVGLMTLDRLPQSHAAEVRAVELSPPQTVAGIEMAPPLTDEPDEAADIAAAGAQLLSMSELGRRRLIENLTDELSGLPAGTLEAVLVLFSRADLAFGQDLTAALGG